MSDKTEDLINRPNHYCKYNVELESIDVVDLFSFNLQKTPCTKGI